MKQQPYNPITVTVTAAMLLCGFMMSVSSHAKAAEHVAEAFVFTPEPIECADFREAICSDAISGPLTLRD